MAYFCHLAALTTPCYFTLLLLMPLSLDTCSFPQKQAAMLIVYNYGQVLTMQRANSVPLLLVWILQAHKNRCWRANKQATYMAAPYVLKWHTYCNLATVIIERPRELPELKNPLFTFCFQLSGTGGYLYSHTSHRITQAWPDTALGWTITLV